MWKHYAIGVVCLAFLSAGVAEAQAIANAGFDHGLDAWSVKAQSATSVVASKDGRAGKGAVEIASSDGVVEQAVSVTTETHYHMTVHVKGAGLVGVVVGDRVYFDRMSETRKWKPVTIRFNSGAASSVVIFASYNGMPGQFDDFQIVDKGRQEGQKVSHNVVSRSAGGTGLSPDLPPSGNFDLLGWHLTLPIDANGDGKADRIDEIDLAKGFQDQAHFYTASDGGMVFRVPVKGAKTSENTSFTRTELREMLRRSDTSISTRNEDGTPTANNWVLSAAPASAQKSAGGVDGVLEATLAVNHVTTTGAVSEVGRVIIGQIHAKDDEPIRLYYRKLPGHARGSVYGAHESKNRADDVFFDIIGSRADNAADPVDGVALDETFFYRIEVQGNKLLVSVIRENGSAFDVAIDMTASGYDVADDYLYFKAGVYTQNKSGDPDDFDQATFYRLKTSHGAPPR